MAPLCASPLLSFSLKYLLPLSLMSQKLIWPTVLLALIVVILHRIKYLEHKVGCGLGVGIICG